MIENKNFEVKIDESGYISNLYMKNDPHTMNWVIDDNYLNQAGYADQERLFGHFDLTLAGESFSSSNLKPVITEEESSIIAEFTVKDSVKVRFTYDLSRSGEELFWKIDLINTSAASIPVDDFGVWAAFAYVMYRDKNVLRNIHESAAVFPSISTDFTKINAVRRGNQDGNLGLYQVTGKTLSVGTYCDYENLFFENVSPSLDGMLFHKLILAGGYPEDFENRDWIYSKEKLTLAPNEEKTWEYALTRNESKADFEEQGRRYGHAAFEYTPLNICGETAAITFETAGEKAVAAKALYMNDTIQAIDLSDQLTDEGKQALIFKPIHKGEHKIVVTFADGREDFVVLNVMDHLEMVIEDRAAYICNELYNGADGSTPYAFEPVSNQGESLGKLNLVLKKNILGTLDVEQVRKVEESAVNYVRPKWFVEGDFKKPVNLYGEFYRCMDFEYIGHLFYLLSEFDDEVLALNDPQTYLSWAADVFDLRVNPDLHEDERGKEEAQMLGVYFLYIQELLEKLKENGLTEKYQTIDRLWQQVTKRVDTETPTYKAAITEHFYDNAGFGPTAGALSESGYLESAEKYGQLLLANIGYSNDFRGQNPDRWWEALAYMIHSLWGGVTAAATFKVYQGLGEIEYLKASYRATAGILYCYDTNSTTTLSLDKGMAASTYAVAGPHLNRPDLSRQRFGQATFYRDGGIFSRLFDNDSQTPDWDMGEELVAYLDSFGQYTYILETANGIEVINGSAEEQEDCYLVTSFAPYCKAFAVIKADGSCQYHEAVDNEKRITIAKAAPMTLK